MDRTPDNAPVNPAVPTPPTGRPKVFAASILAGIAGGLFGAIAADLLGLSAVLAGGVAGVAMAVLIALILTHERKRAA